MMSENLENLYYLRPGEAAPTGDSVLPDFEGQKVSLHQYKLTGLAGDTGPVLASGIDAMVSINLTGVISRVDHVVDRTTGKIKRIETIHVDEIVQVGLDVSNHHHEEDQK